MQRFLRVIGIITFIGLLCQVAQAQAQTNQTVNNDSRTMAVNFTTVGCAYSWTNNAPTIGLPAKGTGNIAPFIALNDGDTPIIATVKATAAGCPIVLFTITVNPTIPTINIANTPLTLNTVYGTASLSKSFTVAGTNLKEGIVVTAPQDFEVSTDNNTFSKTLTLNSDNAQLSYINLNPDVIRTTVSGPGDYNYSATVDNSVQTIRITPVAASALSTIKINGQITDNGTDSAPIALVPGSNTINISVTAQNGITTKKYVITVIRAGSSDATLSGLAISQGTIGPAFSPVTLNYTTTVYTSTITITPTAANDGATVKVNGITVPAGEASASIALNNSSNVIPIVVTAQDGLTTQTYNLTVISSKSSNAGLSQLFLTPATILHRITGTTNYTAVVSSATNSIQQTAIKSDANATIKVNGITVASAAASFPISLNSNGNTIITTVITAQDGKTTQTYTVTISKSLPGNTNLSQLFISPTSTLVQTQGDNYTTSVDPTITSIQETIVKTDEQQTVKVNGITIVSGVASKPILLNATGPTIITTVVTAPNGINTKTYTITINKTGATNSNINDLALTIPADISQTLGTFNYTTSVNPVVTSVQQKLVTKDANATIKVNGQAVASGQPSQLIMLNATGTTTVTSIVTAQDGKTSQTYTLTISKNGSTNTIVDRLGLTPIATLTPVAGTNNFTTSVSPDVTSVQQTIVPNDPNATIKINGIAVAAGIASKPILLNSSGTTAITTLITAQDGLTTRTIVTTISKNGATNTDVDQMLLTPSATFIQVPGTTNFTTSVAPDVSSVQQTIITNDPDATISINGIAVASGMASPPIALNANGKTSITIIITAANKTTTKTYTVVVSKNGSTNTDINQLYLTPSTALNAITGTNNYITSVGSSVQSVQLTIIPADQNAAILVNGIPVAAGIASAPIILNSTGTTAITATVTAQDGISTKTYLITATRGSNGGLLSPLTSNLLPTPVYVRLTLTAPAGIYNDNVLLSSNPAVARQDMVNCKVDAAPLTITTGNITKSYGTALIDVSGAKNFTITTGSLKNGNIINSLNINFMAGAAAGATAGKYRAAIVPSGAKGDNGFNSSNYNINYIPADLFITPVPLTIIADNKTKDFGVDNPPLTITYTGFVNGDGPGQLFVKPVINTPAVTRSTIGTYPINVYGAASPNYVFTYVQGLLTVSAAHLNIFIPNTITPNGDGINDTWSIKNIDAYPNTTIDIFDRQGQKVFTSAGYGLAWDGTYNGRPLPTGTYYYFIKNSITTMSGSLTVIR